MPDTEPVVKVTLTSIYERVVSVEGKVQHLTTELPTHVRLTKTKQSEYDGRLNAHAARIDEAETRLTRLESAQRPAVSAFSVIAGVSGILTSVATLVTLITILSRIPA